MKFRLDIEVEKVKYKIAGFVLILIIVPLLMGCELTPEDKWPVLVDEIVDADFTVSVTEIEDLGLLQFKVVKERVDLTLDIRTFNANQGFKVEIILQDIQQNFTDYTNPTAPVSYSALMGFIETFKRVSVTGEYIDGSPPQGVTELTLYFTPSWFPVTFTDWINGAIITDSYIYYFLVIIEDMDGRTDSFEFQLTSRLAA